MLGNPDNEKKKGIIPRALESIFQAVHSDKDHSYQFRIAYIQIYMEMVYHNPHQFLILSFKI
jgi:hypothetical protein